MRIIKKPPELECGVDRIFHPDILRWVTVTAVTPDGPYARLDLRDDTGEHELPEIEVSLTGILEVLP